LHLIQLTSTIVLVPMLLHAWMCVWLAPVSCKCASYKTLSLFQAKMALLMEPLLPHKHCRLRACLTTSALSVSASAARPSAAASSACASVRTWCTYATRSHSRAWRGTSSIEGVLAFTPASSLSPHAPCCYMHGIYSSHIVSVAYQSLEKQAQCRVPRVHDRLRACLTHSTRPCATAAAMRCSAAASASARASVRACEIWAHAHSQQSMVHLRGVSLRSLLLGAPPPHVTGFTCAACTAVSLAFCAIHSLESGLRLCSQAPREHKLRTC